MIFLISLEYFFLKVNPNYFFVELSVTKQKTNLMFLNIISINKKTIYFNISFFYYLYINKNNNIFTNHLKRLEQL